MQKINIVQSEGLKFSLPLHFLPRLLSFLPLTAKLHNQGLPEPSVPVEQLQGSLGRFSICQKKMCENIVDGLRFDLFQTEALSHQTEWWKPGPSSDPSAAGTARVDHPPAQTWRTVPPAGPLRHVHSGSSDTTPTLTKKQVLSCWWSSSSSIQITFLTSCACCCDGWHQPIPWRGFLADSYETSGFSGCLPQILGPSGSLHLWLAESRRW